MTTAAAAVPAIVPIGVHDAALLAAIHATSFPAPWSEEDFALFLRQPGMAAWAGGIKTASGFILTRRVADEAEILTIAVMPAARQRGIARAVLMRALEELRKRGLASAY